MPRFMPRPIALACLVCATAACSQTASPPALSTNASPSSTSAPTTASSNPRAPLDCDKVFVPSDVAGVFTAPVKVSRDSIRNGCTFATDDGGSLNINTGGGDDANFSLPWNDVTKSTDSVNFLPLPGVGDQAFFRKATAIELFSKKGDLYCMASMTGLEQAGVNHIAGQSAEERAKALGALCNKAFAAN